MIGIGNFVTTYSTTIGQEDLGQKRARVNSETITKSAFRCYESEPRNSVTTYSTTICREDLGQKSAGVNPQTITKSAFRPYEKAAQVPEDQLVSTALVALFSMKTGEPFKAIDSQTHGCHKFGLELMGCTFLRTKASDLIRNGRREAGKELIKMANQKEARILKKLQK
jgi:hypothetical protein